MEKEKEEEQEEEEEEEEECEEDWVAGGKEVERKD